MKVIVVQTNNFPGDTFRRIDVDLQDGTGRILPMFGVWPRRQRNGTRYYESDNGGYYKNLREVKTVARKRALEELKFLRELDACK
jgi:hypothetical protein